MGQWEDSLREGVRLSRASWGSRRTPQLARVGWGPGFWTPRLPGKRVGWGGGVVVTSWRPAESPASRVGCKCVKAPGYLPRFQVCEEGQVGEKAGQG